MNVAVAATHSAKDKAMAHRADYLDIRDAMQALLEQEQHQERVLIDYIAGIGYR